MSSSQYIPYDKENHQNWPPVSTKGPPKRQPSDAKMAGARWVGGYLRLGHITDQGTYPTGE